MKKTHISLILFILFGLVFNNSALSWDDKVTHKDLSNFAAENSVLSQAQGNYLINLGLNKGLDEPLTWNGISRNISLWLQEGAQLEDKSSTLFPILGTTRSLNHFHNPLKPWSQAGLDDYYLGHWTGESSLVWAQDGNAQQNVVEGDWSWQKTRSYYYTALTSITESARQDNFAKTFRGLGHQMHLLQDTAVPDHTRNDAHPEDAMFGSNPFTGSAYFESWARDNSLYINSLAASPIVPSVSLNVPINGYAPITQLYDTDTYNGTNPSTSLNQGLSEYTNANFFSNDTIFAAEVYQTNDRHYFPYPKKTSTDLQTFIAGSKAYETITAEDGTTDNGYWISKTGDGETINHFLRAGYFTDIVYNAFGEGNLYHSTFYRDEKCHADYAEKLVPRAVGYSASLVDYFFRGSIDISLPSSGIYSMVDTTPPGFDPAAATFTNIQLLAKNSTSTGEQMTNGNIKLVVKYRLAQGDPFHSVPVSVGNDFYYIVVQEANNVTSIPSNTTVALTFNLSPALPLYATDVYLQVIFKGTLGHEDNAVAVGFKDISEPTPIDIFNNMDKICIFGQWYATGSIEAYNALPADKKWWDYWAHDLQDEYIKISSSINPSNASTSNYTFHVPLISAGTLHREYILSDYDFNRSAYGSMIKKDSGDTANHTGLRKISSAYAGYGILNQEDTNGTRQTSLFYDFRGVELWGSAGYIVDGLTYPNYTDPGYIPCSWNDLP